jgi:hypothetical protein
MGRRSRAVVERIFCALLAVKKGIARATSETSRSSQSEPDGEHEI